MQLGVSVPGLTKHQNCKELFVIQSLSVRLFFCPQLIYDFHDMEEDFESSRNDNLFVAHTTQNSYQYVFDRRLVILRALIPYIIENLINLKAMGGIYQRHYEQARSYLESKLPEAVPYIKGIFPQPFHNYRLSVATLNGVQPNKTLRPITITAEEAHTLRSH